MLVLRYPYRRHDEVFGNIVDSYTMTESVQDEITVRIVYEGRAAGVSMPASWKRWKNITKSAPMRAPTSGKSTRAKASATMNAIR